VGKRSGWLQKQPTATEATASFLEGAPQFNQRLGDPQCSSSTPPLSHHYGGAKSWDSEAALRAFFRDRVTETPTVDQQEGQGTKGWMRRREEGNSVAPTPTHPLLQHHSTQRTIEQRSYRRWFPNLPSGTNQSILSQRTSRLAALDPSVFGYRRILGAESR
jgi:hypothetical protein